MQNLSKEVEKDIFSGRFFVAQEAVALGRRGVTKA